MGRPGLTDIDVARACVSLLKQRRVVTPTNLRLELGRGSYSTITRHLRRLAIVNVGSARGLRAHQSLAQM